MTLVEHTKEMRLIIDCMNDFAEDVKTVEGGCVYKIAADALFDSEFIETLNSLLGFEAKKDTIEDTHHYFNRKVGG